MRLFALGALCTLLACPIFGTQYIGIHAGTNNAMLTREGHNPKIGYKMGATYGYKFDNGFRAEFALGYKKNNFKTRYNLLTKDQVESSEYREIYALSYMINGIYDLPQMRLGDVTPYLGIGAGYSQNSEKNKIKRAVGTVSDKYRDNRFAYQAIVGAKYDVNAIYSTGLEYQYCCSRSHCKDHSVAVSMLRNF